MKLERLLELISYLREETYRFCRGSTPDREMLESLGWALVCRYDLLKRGRVFDEKVVQFVIECGEG